MEDTLRMFAAILNKTVEDGINEMGSSVARKLADRVQPYGLKSDKGKKFIESIGRQVDRVWIGVNLGALPATSDMKTVHYAARNGSRKGVVPDWQFRRQKSKPWLGLIPTSEREIYKRKVQAKAGRAKGAWIEAGNAIGGKKLSGIANWIARHAAGGYGSATKSGKELNYKLTLENRTPYMGRILPPDTVEKTVALGVKNGFNRISKTIDKAIEKANRTT